MSALFPNTSFDIDKNVLCFEQFLIVSGRELNRPAVLSLKALLPPCWYFQQSAAI